MIIKELNLGHFGKFHKKEVILKPGINLIYGENEAGKSTLHAFIRGMLFGIERARGRAAKEELYTKYEPWETPGAYQGSMELVIDDKAYRVFRSFYKKEKRIQVIDTATGKEIAQDEHGMQELLCGLTENVYRNTVSIEQLKAKTDLELAAELKNFITNLSMTKSTEVDVGRALGYLTDKRKQLEKSLPTQQLAELTASIEKERQILDEMEQLNIELKTVEDQAEDVRKKMLQYSDNTCRDKLAKLAQLPAIKEKYGSYKEIFVQINQIEDRLNGLTERTKKQVSELDNAQTIQQHLAELHELRQKKQGLEDESRKKRLAWEESQKKRKLNGKTLGILGAVSGLAVCMLPFLPIFIRGCLGVGLMVLGLVQYIYKATKDQHSLQSLEEIERDFERQIFQFHSKRHDILLGHRVANETQLVLKYNEVTKNELEREQMLERKAEFLLSLKELREKAEKLEDEIVNYMKYFITDPDACESCMQELKAVAEEFREETIQGEKKYQAQYEELRGRMEHIRWTLEANRNQEVKLMQDMSEYSELQKQKAEIEKEITAVALSIQTLKELSTCIHNTFGSRLNEVVSEHIEKITKGEYREVTIDEQLNIQVRHGDRYVSIEQLSAGTIDQMYLSLRLAVADLLFPDVNLPIILDDAFAMYDDERTKEVLLLLASETHRQIILLTCHHREQAILEQENIKANYVELV